jgi:hypothetical protein
MCGKTIRKKSYIRLILNCGFTVTFGLLFNGCLDSPIKDTFYYESGKKKKEIFYRSSEPTSKYKEVGYYESGKIKGVSLFENGKKNDWEFNYYENGNLKNKKYYEDGNINGYCFWFKTNGHIDNKSFWLNGKEYGDVFFYYDNQKLELYNAIDFENKNFYVLSYDSVGNKLKEDGVTFSPVFLYSPYNSEKLFVWRDTLKTDVSAKILITIARPPKTNTEIQIEVRYMNLKEPSKLIELPIKDCSAIWKPELTNKGNYKIKVVGKITDKSGILLKKV